MGSERGKKTLELADENEQEDKNKKQTKKTTKTISGHRAAKSKDSKETELVLTDNLKLLGTL